jgi:hypothetical protein
MDFRLTPFDLYFTKYSLTCVTKQNIKSFCLLRSLCPLPTILRMQQLPRACVDVSTELESLLNFLPSLARTRNLWCCVQVFETPCSPAPQMLSLTFADALYLAEASRGRCVKCEQNTVLSFGKEEVLAAQKFISVGCGCTDCFRSPAVLRPGCSGSKSVRYV